MGTQAGEREYELIVWGATGYTGKLTAQHITENFPHDFKWAVAGRNRGKLEGLVRELTRSNPSRQAPGVLTASLNYEELDNLSKKTRLIIATVGPYQAYGSPTFAACARNGTHYLDVTAETFWVADMTRQYEKTAKESGSIMIPCCGFDCVPSDISTWVAADQIRRDLKACTRRVDVCIYSLETSISGGTLTSVIRAFDNYSFRQLYRMHAPYALSPKRPNPTVPPKPTSLFMKLFGLLRIPELGWMGYQPQAVVDRVIVHRTWGLLESTPNAYGHNFDFHAWVKLWGPISAFFWHMALMSLTALFLLRPFRWLLSKTGYQPGEGANLENTNKRWMEFRTVAQPDIPSSDAPRKGLVRLRYDRDPYIFTALAIAEAARVILRGHDKGPNTLGRKLEGGVFTPATLGNRYVNQLREAGVTIESRTTSPEEGKKKQL